MLSIGNSVPKETEVCDIDMNFSSLASLLRGPEYLICILCPFAFEAKDENTMEKLILEVNGKLATFTQREIRVIVVNGEPALTNKMWVETRNLEIEVFSDRKLELATMLTGTRDWAEHLLNSKGVRLGGSLPIALPGVVLISSAGIVRSKVLSPDPDNITICLRDVEKMVGLSV